MPYPSDKAGVQRLLGMATFLSRYAKNFSEVTAPLRELLKSENASNWINNVHGKAVNEIRKLLTNAPVLSYYDVNKTVI